MRTLVWEAPSVMNVREQAAPQPQPGEVLIKVAYAGICGSELSGYLGHNALRVPPLVMGHEFSGEVVALGANVHTKNPALAEGQHVTVNPIVFCGTCDYCKRGLNHLCVRRKVIGAHLPGAYAEFISVPAESVLPLPSTISLRAGALTEPVACAVRIGELAGSLNDETALVIGAGPIGLLAMQALYLNCAKRVFIADLDPARLAMAKSFGGEALNPREGDVVETVRQATDGLGAAVSVDAVGTAVTRKQCVSATRSAGTLILTGLHEETSAMPVADIIRREIVAHGSFAYSPNNFAEALRLLAAGKFRLDPWIVEAPLADGGPWFERLINAPGDVAKVLLTP